MAKPAWKAPELEKELDRISESLNGRKRTESIQADICVDCGGSAKEFRDGLSAKEYTISGLCQTCQDAVFGQES